MTNFEQMSEETPRGGAIATIKSQMPCTFVLDVMGGCEFEVDSGEYITRSPFRQDRTPSLRVYGDKLDRWIDFAAGDSGDVVDLIGMFLDTDDVSEKIAKAHELMPDLATWDGPRQGAPKKTFDVEAARAYVLSLESYGSETLAELFRHRKDYLRDVDPDFIADRFQIEADDDGLIIPYLSRSRDLVGIKTRRTTPGEPTISAGGSDWSDILYGEHLDDDRKRIVVLCEGETDVWSGTHALRNSDEYVFLGLPTGAGSYPRQAPRLAGRHVVLAMDGDPAGRGALLKWIPALKMVNCTVYVAPIPEGRDLSQIYDIPGLLRAAMRQSVRTPMGGLSVLDGSYRRRTQKEPKPISNFVLEVTSSLVDPGGGTTYVVRADGNAAEFKLRPSDLDSGRQMKVWAQSHDLSWSGNDADTVELAALLKLQSYGAPVREAVSIAGYHEEHFVWPGGSIGNRDVQYLPPTDSAVGRIDIRLQDEEPAPFLVSWLRDLHDHNITDPILAWLAMAPLRSLYERFPILNVTGPSGSGKTTLLTNMVGMFSGSYMMSTLTGTTRFAVLAQMQSTNAFPVWFDEYRPGARNATLQELNQLLRDAYAGQASLKGGAGDTWNEVTEFRTEAPVIVSGEDNFREISHKQRMILVQLPYLGKNPEALKRLPPEGTPSPLGIDYMTWLLKVLDEWGVPVITPTGPEHWEERQRYNLGVLVAGWSLLNAWLHERGHEGLGEPDWSMMIEAGNETYDSDPVIDAIEWALGEAQLMSYVYVQGEEIFVHTQTLVRETKRLTDIVLPGGDQAIARILITKYGGANYRSQNDGARKRFVRIPIPEQLR